MFSSLASGSNQLHLRKVALDATELGAEVGTRNIVEVLRARENLYRALRQYADARYNYVVDQLNPTTGSGNTHTTGHY